MSRTVARIQLIKNVKCQVLRLERQILWFSLPAPSSWFNLHSSGAILKICPKFFCHEFPNTEESTVMSSLESLAPPKQARMIIHYGSFTFKSLCGFGDLCKRFPILKDIKYSKNKIPVRNKELALPWHTMYVFTLPYSLFYESKIKNKIRDSLLVWCPETINCKWWILDVFNRWATCVKKFCCIQ